MTSPLVPAATACALGAGLSAGSLFAFSAFVMPALDRLVPEEAIRAMQAINVQAPTPAFMTALFGTGLAGIATSVWSAVTPGRPGLPALVAGTGLYLAALMVTMAFHVPRNDALARLGSAPVDAAARWHEYSGAWTAGNHVRTALSLAAAACYVLAAVTARSR